MVELCCNWKWKVPDIGRVNFTLPSYISPFVCPARRQLSGRSPGIPTAGIHQTLMKDSGTSPTDVHHAGKIHNAHCIYIALLTSTTDGNYRGSRTRIRTRKSKFFSFAVHVKSRIVDMENTPSGAEIPTPSPGLVTTPATDEATQKLIASLEDRNASQFEHILRMVKKVDILEEKIAVLEYQVEEQREIVERCKRQDAFIQALKKQIASLEARIE
ncbi:hypothetical protein RUND412_005570 [Rhizina undulata]